MIIERFSSDIKEELISFINHLNRTHKRFTLEIDGLGEEITIKIKNDYNNTPHILYSDNGMNYQNRKILYDTLKSADKILTGD